jgi:hypothetical protein
VASVGSVALRASVPIRRRSTTRSATYSPMTALARFTGPRLVWWQRRRGLREAAVGLGRDGRRNGIPAGDSFRRQVIASPSVDARQHQRVVSDGLTPSSGRGKVALDVAGGLGLGLPPQTHSTAGGPFWYWSYPTSPHLRDTSGSAPDVT